MFVMHSIVNTLRDTIVTNEPIVRVLRVCKMSFLFVQEREDAKNVRANKKKEGTRK